MQYLRCTSYIGMSPTIVTCFAIIRVDEPRKSPKSHENCSAKFSFHSAAP